MNIATKHDDMFPVNPKLAWDRLRIDYKKARDALEQEQKRNQLAANCYAECQQTIGTIKIFLKELDEKLDALETAGD